MKVLFVDIDGVLVPSWSLSYTNELTKFGTDPFDKECIKKLNKIIDSVDDIELVISSNWKDGLSISEIRELFDQSGVNKKPIAFTPKNKKYNSMFLEYGRLVEILQFVVNHRLQNWVAIDDLELTKEDKYNIIHPHFFKTKEHEGLNCPNSEEEIVKKFNNIFNDIVLAEAIIYKQN